MKLLDLTDADVDLAILQMELEQARRVVVMASTGYRSIRTGRVPVSELVYLWPGGPLAEGDLVLCPPCPWMSGPFEAVVVSLDASSHPYQGPVKAILGRVNS